MAFFLVGRLIIVLFMGFIIVMSMCGVIYGSAFGIPRPGDVKSCCALWGFGLDVQYVVGIS